MTGCLKNIPEHMHWWEEFESSHDAPQAPHIDGAGGQSGRIGFLLAPWNSQKKKGGCLGCQATGNVVHQLSHRNVVKLGGSLAWGEEDWVQMHHQQQWVRKSYKKIGKKK